MIESTKQEVERSIIYEIVEEIAEDNGTTECEIKPLHESVDADALEDLFERPELCIKVEFTHEGQKVVVEKNPEIQVNII
ncbi:HalOD1 output domain-containing protein [Natrinema sp. H-ect4]|uniref:HalOD1 output domain-containing protein n=1 Tax=Natrinema sp. H-ect4 TaxID=3242699 RepID=UPI0035A86D05